MSTPAAPTSDRLSALRPARGDGPGRLTIHALITGSSFLAYILARMLDGSAGLVMAAIGASACGWAWLFARALFDPAPRDAVWSRSVVAVVALSGAIQILAPDEGMAAQVAGNLYVMSGSAALLLTLIEPFQTHGRRLSRRETWFRGLFVAGFALLAGASVLGVWLTPEPIQIASATFGLFGAVVAIAYRLRHPLPALDDRVRRPATEEDRRLGEQLMTLLNDQAVFADPDVRIGDVAARLGESEHRVSRCISAALGYANFNRLINHHRIRLARHLLAQAEERRTILEIALDCGFASIGPFNRAFKAETGMTPRAYRAEALARPTADPACPARAGAGRSA
ncbi:MAG: helix-turn-helix transcriptional regulator [Caulobacterales bacterium]|nr:helix-turn-helix transcriptional regulator [Caulobacterales bacterium]